MQVVKRYRLTDKGQPQGPGFLESLSIWLPVASEAVHIKEGERETSLYVLCTTYGDQVELDETTTVLKDLLIVNTGEYLPNDCKYVGTLYGGRHAFLSMAVDTRLTPQRAGTIVRRYREA